MKPYYDEGGITIYHGRCEDVLPMVGRSDIIVTSPPYNMGLTPGGNGRGLYTHLTSKGRRFSTDGYDGRADSMPWEAYCEWQRGCLALMFDRSERAVFYNHRPRVMHGKLTPPLDGDYGHESHGFDLRQIIVWDRLTGIDVNLRHFCTRAEWVILFARPEFRLVDHAASGMGDVWRLGMDQSGVDHPAPFPVSLPARCIAASGARSVLDPFMGSGTTLRAAKDAGVRSIGIDTSERYCEIAAKRLAQEVLAL